MGATFAMMARFFIMRTLGTFCVATVALLGAMGGALAMTALDPPPVVLTEHEKMLKYQDQQSAQPYAMNYTDEAAQSLGLRNGRLDMLEQERSRDGFMPSVSGGLDSGRPAIRLQWRLGQ